MSDVEAWEERQRREGVFKEEEEVSLGHDGPYGPDPMTHLLMAWQCMVRLAAPVEMRRATMKIIHTLGDMQVEGELLGDDDMDVIITDAGYGHRRRPKKRSGGWVP